MRQIHGFALLAAALLVPAVQAGPIAVSGAATGCFFAAPATTCTPASADTDGHLHFTGASFTGTTTYTAILGTLVLDNGTTIYDGTLDLLLTFTAPAGSGAATYDALLKGSVHGNFGSVTLTFANPTQTVSFPGVDGTGSFSVALLNGGQYSVSTGDASVPLQATISGSASDAPVGTPEPGSVVLFATGLGLVGLGWLRRHRAQG